MALQYVQPGQKITAEGYNRLVDVASGSGNSSAEGFVNTGAGSVFYNRAQLKTKYYNGAWRTMFQVVPAYYYKQTSRGQWDFTQPVQQTLLIDLGADADSCKQNVTVRGKSVEDGCVVVGASQSMDALVDDDLYLNASEEKTPWVDLGIKASGTSFVALDLFSWEEEEEEGKYKDPIYYFAITDKGYEEYDERAKNILGVEGNGIWKSLRRFMLNKKGASQYGDSHKTQIQEHSGAISWSDPISSEILSGDSEMLSSKLSSIQTVMMSCEVSSEVSGEVETTTQWNRAIQYFNFQEDHTPLSDMQILSTDVVVRRIPEGSEETSANYFVDYVPLSDMMISCDADNTHPLSSMSITNKDHEVRIYGFTKADENFEETGRGQYLSRDLKNNANVADIALRVLSGGEGDDCRQTEFISLYDVMEKHPDSMMEDQMSSLEYVHLSTDQMQVDYMELYHFNEKEHVILSAELPEKKNYLDIVVRDWTADDDHKKAQVSYLPLSCLSSANISVDTTFPDSHTSSIVIAANERGETYLMLKGFKDEEAKDTVELSNFENIDVLIRENNGVDRELKYVNISSMLSSISCDSELSANCMSSMSFTDEKRDTLQIFKFKDLENRDVDYLKSHLEKIEFVLRNRLEDGKATVDYTSLSALSALLSSETISSDSEATEGDQCSSIWRINDGKQFSLFKFHEDENIERSYLSSHESTLDVLLRDRTEENKNVLRYVSVSAILSSMSCDLSGDTHVDQTYTSSIVILDNADGKKYVMVKGFDGETCVPYSEISANPEDYDVLVRHFVENAANDSYEMKYVNISSFLSGQMLSADAEVEALKRYSIEKVGDKKDILELYNFMSVDTDPISVTIGKDPKMSDKQYQFLIRNNDTENGRVVLEYAQLCVDTGISVDSDLSDQMSIEFNKEEDFYQLYDFDKVDKAPISICLGPQVKMTDKQYQILVRNNDTDNDKVRLEYAQLCVDNRISVDSDLSDQFSIEFKKDEDYYQLWDFDTTSASLSITLGNGEDCEKKLDDNYQILVRSRDSGKNTLEYASLCIEISAMSADSEVPEKNVSSIMFMDSSKDVISLHQFGGNGVVDAAWLSSHRDTFDVLLRDRTAPGKYELVYAKSSDFLSGLSAASADVSVAISGDTQIPDCNTSSIVTLSTDSGIAIRVKGFDGQEALATEVVSANTAAYDVLLRHKDGASYDMQYVNISALLSGSALSGDELRKPRKNWDWPTQVNSETGKTEYCPPGTGTLYGYYFKGYQSYSYSATLPAQPEGKTILVISGLYSSYGAAYAWTDSYPSKNLSAWSMPLYARYNSPDNGPTFDYNAGMFTIPTYY